jgi:hypothetical protein
MRKIHIAEVALIASWLLARVSEIWFKAKSGLRTETGQQSVVEPSNTVPMLLHETAKTNGSAMTNEMLQDVATRWDANADQWTHDVRNGYDTYRELFTFPAFVTSCRRLPGSM